MELRPTAKTIVEQWLVSHGCDGLSNETGCGCGFDDLGDCGDLGASCVPSYSRFCAGCWELCPAASKTPEGEIGCYSPDGSICWTND
ncbi:hypothetical protein [Xiamenia xianingshaonis]|uniref:Uncharacterized protein n=1 Tax=Xiamenia xianingshaonis TaxID=2682776 RepID=A0ABX0IFE8_9ACTN|nr:hypothetical protein [Xiamenia xianingshaonis]NHM13504.1 hypothetical protein [Xiamenia xianingshaonis]